MRIPLETFECGNLLKVLLSTRCRYDCKYCPNAWRKGLTITPSRLAEFVKLNQIDKVFISSSLFAEADEVMDRIIEAGSLIRDSVSYLHLKIMPHTEKDDIIRAAKIADRISLNFESARKDILSELSSFKNFHEFIKQQRTISKVAKKLGKSFTTQIIVGLGESDYDILKFAEIMYKKFGASRVYYSPFRPIGGTPLESYRPEKKERIQRLYRADALIRIYGYSAKKIREIMEDGFLPKGDPKMLLAEKTGIEKTEQIPGIGIKAAKLLDEGYSVSELRKMGFRLGRASAYLNEQRKLNEWLAL
jgi:predicted DNA-binding helix-hairpin-helix protein